MTCYNLVVPTMIYFLVAISGMVLGGIISANILSPMKKKDEEK